MKILVSFQPNKKAPDFEGVRLRKTIKGSLEMAGVDYTTSIVEKYDAIHLMTPEDENKLNDAKENHVPVIVSALYCESDPVANYLEYKSKDGVRHTRLSDKALRFLNKADLVLVPSLKARDLLVDSGVTSDISVSQPGVNMSRFDFSREEEKNLFFRYFREDPKKRLVIGLGEYDANMDGINAFINAAKKCPDVLFYYVGRELIPGAFTSIKVKKIINSSPKNLKFTTVMPDDIYRSALLNADVFVIPGYRPAGAMSLVDAMGAKCQIIARRQAVFTDLIEDGKTGYLGEYSETISSLVRDYLEGKLKPTIDEAHCLISEKNNLKVIGEQLKWFYVEQINIKKLEEI